MDSFSLHFDKSNNVDLETFTGKIKRRFPVSLDHVVKVLLDCFKFEDVEDTVILPANTVFTRKFTDTSRSLVIAVEAGKRDVLYENTKFEDVGFPKLLFGFYISAGKVNAAMLACCKDLIVKPTTKIYHYPYAHVVGGFNICWGNNKLDDYDEYWKLSSLPNFFLSMPNGNDGYGNNKSGLAYRELLTKMKGRDFDPKLFLDTKSTFEEWIEYIRRDC